MDSATIAQTLWAMTGTWNSDAQVSTARDELAVMLHGGAVAGFPAPVKPAPGSLQSAAWADCVRAAMAAPATARAAANPRQIANPGVPLPSYALISNDNSVAGTGVSWPGSGGNTLVGPAIGPLWNDPSPRGYLFLYDAIDTQFALTNDGDADRGLFPRSSARPRPVAAIADTGRWLPALGWFLASGAVAVLSFLWIYAAAELARGAVAEVNVGTQVGETFVIDPQGSTLVSVDADERLHLGIGETRPNAVAAISIKRKANVVTWVIDAVSAIETIPCPTQLAATFSDGSAERIRAACEKPWAIAWNNQKTHAEIKDSLWGTFLIAIWHSVDVESHFSLLIPLLLSAASIIFLILPVVLQRAERSTARWSTVGTA